jgi:uncharacterized protein (DUF2237 family)
LQKDVTFLIRNKSVVMGINVFGEKIITCSNYPLTGFFRDGCCNTDNNDLGIHTVCVIITNDFLSFSKNIGNDLSTPNTDYNFPGLKEGDKWCLCAKRWQQALSHNCAPKVILEATHEKTLEILSMKDLLEYAYTK